MEEKDKLNATFLLSAFESAQAQLKSVEKISTTIVSAMQEYVDNTPLPSKIQEFLDLKTQKLLKLANDQVEATRKFVKGEELSDDRTYVEKLLYDYREQETVIFASKSPEMPPLSISHTGSNGLAISALFSESFNEVEYSTDKNRPVDVLIAPWSQFGNSKLSDERSKLAFEIARRAMEHDTLISRIISLQANLEEHRDTVHKTFERESVLLEIWKKERTGFGLPADFSDIKDERLKN